MKKSRKQIIDEQVDLYVNKLSKSKLVSLVKENKILDSLEKSYESMFDVDNEITPENWKYFVDSLIKVTDNQNFQNKCKEINCQLYCVKQYTKLKFAIAENAEHTLKFELKKYYRNIVSNDSETFIDSFFNLPFEFVSLVIRYLGNVLLKEKKNLLTPTLKQAQEYFDSTQKKKNLFITEINKLSQGQSNTFSVLDAQILLDVKAFYEYNPINNGVLEFIARILTNKKTKKELQNIYGLSKVALMHDQVLVHASYMQFLQEIKNDLEQAFFTSDGFQNKNREITFDEFVTKYFFPEQFIPEEPEQPKEAPVPTTATSEPSQTTPSTTTPPGNLNVTQPSPEELMKQPNTQ
jgi:hypothetical protein